MMENHRPLASLGESTKINTWESSSTSDCAEEEGDYQAQNQRFKKEEEEEIPIDNDTDGSRNEPRKQPRIVYLKDCKMEDVDDQKDNVVEVSPGGLNVHIKSEVEEAEISVKMKEEEVPVDINQDDLYRKVCPDRGTTIDYQQKQTPPLQKANKASDCATKSTVGQKFPTISSRKLGEAYSCPDCGDFFIHKSSLVLHRQIHFREKSYSCSECGKQFIQKVYNIRYQRRHTDKKTYICSECGKLYAQKQRLVIHQKFHDEKELFSCPDCGENFIRQSHLVTHKKTHKGLRRYTCPDCGDVFTLRSSLVIHQKVHSAERPLSS
ncbi:zinc finger protein 585A-like isoform X2 [Pseudophryne corroboree]